MVDESAKTDDHRARQQPAAGDEAAPARTPPAGQHEAGDHAPAASRPEQKPTEAAAPPEVTVAEAPAPQDEQEQTRGVDWADPTVPAGNAPPLPRWPAYVAAAAWGLWIIFLAAMMMTAA